MRSDRLWVTAFEQQSSQPRSLTRSCVARGGLSRHQNSEGRQRDTFGAAEIGSTNTYLDSHLVLVKGYQSGIQSRDIFRGAQIWTPRPSGISSRVTATVTLIPDRP